MSAGLTVFSWNLEEVDKRVGTKHCRKHNKDRFVFLTACREEEFVCSAAPGVAVANACHDEPQADAAGKRRGGGGPWRAFLHMRSRGGTKLSGDSIRDLAAEYKLLTAEQKQEFVQLGRLATKAHKLGGASFPMYSRRARLRRGKADDLVLGQRAQASLSEEHMSLQHRVLAGEAVPIPADILALHPQSPPPSDKRSACKEMFAELVRRQGQHLQSLRKEKETTQHQELCDVVDKARERAVAFLEGRKTLAPCMPHTTFFSHATKTCDHMTVAFSGESLPYIWEDDKSDKSLASRCAEWEQQHECLRARDWQHPCPRLQRKTCHDAGFCCCHRSPDGVRLRTMRMRVTAFLKHTSQGDEPQKARGANDKS
eukprot:6479120-Amphidinium_carterae.2